MECEPGYFGPFCNNSCPIGKFGDRCGGSCFPVCTNEFCDPVKGCFYVTRKMRQTTSLECKPGYFGPYCNISCPVGKFGDRCGGSCFPGCTNEFCDSVKGCFHITEKVRQTTSSGAAYSLQAATSLHATVGVQNKYTSKTTHLKDVNSSRFIIKSTNTSSITENPVEKHQIDNSYLTVSLGILISMLLLIIVIQLCKKSKSARKKPSKQKSNVNQICEEFCNDPQNRDEKYLTISSSQRFNNFYRNMDAVYNEIDDSLELIHTVAFKNGESEFESDTIPVQLKDSSSLKNTNDGIIPQSSDLYLLPNTQGECEENINNSDSYIQPVSVLKNEVSDNKVETCSYVDITG